MVEIIAAPFREFDALWTLLPIYISWILLEYFPERREPQLGNVFLNGFSAIWVGMNWIRRIYYAHALTGAFIAKLFPALFMILWGFFLMREALKAGKGIKLIGRGRYIAFLTIVFTPYVYGFIEIDLITLLAILSLFILIHPLIWLFKAITPEPLEEGARRREFRKFEEVVKAKEELKKLM